ncbi:hypothetical protein [Candidatus Uabimicrobium sp. HlEnr_7]|uniref:hypothetical protein n=1 Tax=Candidatus Uabimicrobium helgolandensis TaxID=3095367 RepID=UPI00355844B6
MENSEREEEHADYVARVEDLAEDFLHQLEHSDEENESDVNKLIHLFIKDSQKIFSERRTDEEINKLWQNLREKMMDREIQDQGVNRTTKRYVREFLDDIQPKSTNKREKSSKIKLTEAEQKQLKLFGQL